MITRIRHGLSAAAVSILCMLMSTFSAFAANVAGGVDFVSDTAISGWAADKDAPDKSAEVTLYIYIDGSTEAKQLGKVKADQYRSDLTESLGDGNHSFSYTVNWDKLDGTSFIVQAYMTSGSEQILLSGSPSYSKSKAAPAAVPAAADAAPTGPAGGSSITAPASVPAPGTLTVTSAETGKKGSSLGSFVTTAYCCCSKCSSGTNLTYSGTVPKANHTISADIDYYPIGTKMMIGNTIYTVEDIGSGIDGKSLDIFFNTHQQALNYGLKTVEVYSVE